MAPQILIVNDNAVMLTMLSVLLTHDGYCTHRAESGAAALEALKTLKCDGLIAQLTVSEIDNLELCRRVRKNLGTSRLPIFLIGPNNAESHSMSLSAGANRYITHPVFMDQVLKALRETLIPALNQSA